MKPAGLGQTERSPCSVGDGVALHLLLRVNALNLVPLEMTLLLDSWYYRAEACNNSSWRSSKMEKSQIIHPNIPCTDEENHSRMGSWGRRELEEENDGYETTSVSSRESFPLFL